MISSESKQRDFRRSLLTIVAGCALVSFMFNESYFFVRVFFQIFFEEIYEEFKKVKLMIFRKIFFSTCVVCKNMQINIAIKNEAPNSVKELFPAQILCTGH